MAGRRRKRTVVIPDLGVLAIAIFELAQAQARLAAVMEQQRRVDIAFLAQAQADAIVERRAE